MIDAVRTFIRDRFGWTDLCFYQRKDEAGWTLWPCGMGSEDAVFVPLGPFVPVVWLDVEGRLFAAAAEYRRRCKDSGQKWCSGCRSWKPAGGGFTAQFYNSCRECRERLCLERHGYSADDYERKVAYQQRREELLRLGKTEEWAKSFDWGMYCLGNPSDVAASASRMNAVLHHINGDYRT